MSRQSPLADLLEGCVEEVVERWRDRARDELGLRLPRETLIDDMPELLECVVRRLRGRASEPGAFGAGHGRERRRRGVRLDQLIREYRLLRCVICEFADAAGNVPVCDLWLADWTISESMERAVITYVEGQEEERRRAADATRYAAELLELGDAFFEVSPDWTVVRTNQHLEELLRTPRSAVLGRSLWGAWPDMARSDGAYSRELRRCMEERVPVTFDEYLRPLEMWTGVTAYPTSTGGVVAYLRDATRRKEIERALALSEARYRGLFENMPQGYYLADVVVDDAGRPCNFRILVINPAFERLTKMAAKDVLGRTVTEVWQETERDKVESYAEATSAGEVVNLLEAYGERWYATTMYSPRPGQVACIFTDVTARVRTEQALHEANERLRQADRHKDEFLATLSHELRNPLAPILNSVFLLERSPPGSERARRAVRVIGRQVEHMTRLIDDLLDVTRISRGKISLQRSCADLRKVVQSTVDDHSELFASRRIALELTLSREAVPVQVDVTRIAQVVGNLLHNAAKFTPQSGRTHVSVGRDDGRAVILVEDTGAGITPEALDQVFRPFTQVSRSPDRREGGLGLGLALVKGLVELHGGSVTAESAGLHKGTCVRVELPLAEGRENRAELPEPARPAEAKRVLVIEDNVDAAASLQELIAMFGHRVEVAHDGREGLERARRFHPDVVFCDLGLPGVDGYEVARALRADPEQRCAFLVALSGHTLPEDIHRARAAGFQEHLAKPASAEALQALLGGASGP